MTASYIALATPPDLATAAAADAPRRYIVLPSRADLVPQGERILPGLWQRLHDEGIFETFFHDWPEMTFGQFVVALSNPLDRVSVVCEIDGADAIIDTAGIGLLTQVCQTATLHRALGNFLFFKRYWGPESKVIGRTLLDSWYADFDIIAGTTPAANHRAIHFIRSLGFREVGSIPDFAMYQGERCASVVSSQTRREWMATRERLFGVAAEAANGS